MVTLHEKKWVHYTFLPSDAKIFKRLLPLMIIVGIYAILVVWIETQWLHLTEDAELLDASEGVLGFVISMILVFRTNTAYDRWWEGRKLWGQLVNTSRNMAIKVNAVLDDTQQTQRDFFMHMVPNFAFALKNHLRKKVALDEFTATHLLTGIQYKEHIPTHIAGIIYDKVTRLYTTNIIKNEQLLTLTVEAQQLMEICGACERISNSPIPFSYSSFIKKIIFFYIITMPWSYVKDTGYYIVPIVVFVFYVLANLELIAEEIEDPFGSDPNDLPTDALSQAIRKSVIEILSKK
jgi:putative membrane protein